MKAEEMKREIVGLRERFTKQFELDGGFRQAVVYPQPVHFQDSGNWQDIDNSLKPMKLGDKTVYRNTANPVTAEFAEFSDADTLVRIEYKDHTLEWGVDQSDNTRTADESVQAQAVLEPRAAKIRNDIYKDDPAMPDKIGSEITYEEVAPGLDLRYRMESIRCKEDIIIKDRAAAGSAIIRIKAPGMCFRMLEDEQIEVYDKVGSEAVFTFPRPIAQDKGGTGAEVPVSLKMSETDDGVVLRYVLDDNCLDSAVYPIVIDPTVNVDNTATNLTDTYIRETAPNTNYSTSHLLVTGWSDSSQHNNISMLRFEKLIDITASDTIVKAQLRMTVDPNYRAEPKYVGAYALTQTCDFSTAKWSNFNANIIDSFAQDCIVSTNSEYVYFDITNLCRTWYTKKNNVAQNFGLALKRPAFDNNSVWNYVQLYSANSGYPPLLTITYVSHAGQEQRWNYQSMSAGRAGTMSADVFNGNTVVTHPDIAMDGLRNPVSVAHTYNSCECESNNYYCGNGWRTSMHQSVHVKTMSDNTVYYVWTDGDGTEHYFKKTGNTAPYSDEDGLHLKLTYTSTKVTITDLQDNVMEFTKQSGWTDFWLTTLKDVLNNTITISWTSERKINRVTDPIGRYVQYGYTGNLLTSLHAYTSGGSDAGYVWCLYGYVGTNLTSIGYSDLNNAGSAYTYEGNLLKRMNNYDGLYVEAVYETTSDYNPAVFSGTVGQQVLRVKSMEQKNGSTLGAKLLFDYRHMSTHVTMQAGSSASVTNDHELIYQFNDRGNIMSVRDKAGYAYYKTYDSTYPNYPDVASRLQRTSVNLLDNHSFESTDNWTTTTTGGATGTHSYDTTIRKQGSRAAKMSRTNTAGIMAISQEVGVTVGETYTASCYARTSVGTVNVQAQAECGATVTGLKQTSVDEWTRISVTFTAGASLATISFRALDGVGNAWFDCAQLEYGEVANRYNMLENGAFERFSGLVPLRWTAKSGNSGTTKEIVILSADPLHPAYLGSYVLSIQGSPDRDKGFYQDIQAAGESGDMFTVGGWASGRSRPIDGEHRRFCMRVQFYSTNNSNWVTGGQVNWNEEWTDWQYASGGVKAPVKYSKIRFYIDYEKNVNAASFDGLALYREAFGEEYAYNDKGLVSAVTSPAGHQDMRYYDNDNNLAQYREPGITETHDTYMHYGFDGEPNKKHLLRYSNSPMYVQDVYAYDSYGNMTAHRRQHTTPTEAVHTSKAYTSNGDRLASETDSRGNTTTYDYNPSGTVEHVTASNGQIVYYAYDAANRISAVAAASGGKTYRNDYGYTNDRLTQVTHSTITDNGADVRYKFDYDALGKPTTVKVGVVNNQETLLSENVYDSDRFQKLRRVNYGNNQYAQYQYDEFGRMIDSRFNDDNTGPHFQYSYDASGKVGKVKDNALNRVMWNEYDEAGRPIRLTEQDLATSAMLRQESLSYDEREHVSNWKETIVREGVIKKEFTTEYEYDYDNRPTKITYKVDGIGSNRTQYEYDGLGRISKRKVRNASAVHETTYSYLGSSVTIPGSYATPTTDLVSTMSQLGVAFGYGYDALTANITSENRVGGSYAALTTYAYDTLGQLVRVNDPTDSRGGSTGTTWVYNYDRGGNLTSREKFAYTTGALGTRLQLIPYYYTNANWEDKPTNYNGTIIAYRMHY